MPAATTKAMTAPPVPPMRKPTPTKIGGQCRQKHAGAKRIHGTAEVLRFAPHVRIYVGRRRGACKGGPGGKAGQ